MIAFLIQVVGISLSGVLAPGPMTASAVDAGIRRPNAGLWMAAGHVLIELPLVLLLVLGLGPMLQGQTVSIAIGSVGGAFMLWLGYQQLADLWRMLLTPESQPIPVAGNASVPDDTPATSARDSRHPLITGIVLSAANPYFLVWWATIGLALTNQALAWGALAIILFMVLHWLCDAVWLEILSVSSFFGTRLLGRGLQIVLLMVCGLMLLGFGSWFLYDAMQQCFQASPEIVT